MIDYKGPIFEALHARMKEEFPGLLWDLHDSYCAAPRCEGACNCLLPIREARAEEIGEELRGARREADAFIDAANADADKLSFDQPHPADYGGQLQLAPNGWRWSLPDQQKRELYYRSLSEYWRWRARALEESTTKGLQVGETVFVINDPHHPCKGEIAEISSFEPMRVNLKQATAEGASFFGARVDQVRRKT